MTLDKDDLKLLGNLLGGKNIDGTLLVGENSPLGQKLHNLKKNDKYEFNGSIYELIDSVVD